MCLRCETVAGWTEGIMGVRGGGVWLMNGGLWRYGASPKKYPSFCFEK